MCYFYETRSDLYQKLQERLQESEDLIHIIVDASQAAMMPRIRDYQHLKLDYSPNTGWVIITGTSWLMHLIVSVFSALLPRTQIKALPTHRDALEFLSKRNFVIADYLNQPMSISRE